MTTIKLVVLLLVMDTLLLTYFNSSDMLAKHKSMEKKGSVECSQEVSHV